LLATCIRLYVGLDQVQQKLIVVVTLHYRDRIGSRIFLPSFGLKTELLNPSQPSWRLFDRIFMILED
jgi:hypothetical protein